MTPCIWVPESVVMAIHDQQIAEHGGLDGVRDAGVIHSALARPQNLLAYGNPDLAALAAAYAFGLSRNHGFVDGNKRVAFVVAETFLNLNGVNLTATDEAVVTTMLAVAAGQMTEEALAEWFREHAAPIRQ